MQVGTHPTRNFAALGPLWLQPPFTRTYIQSNFSPILFIFWHRAGVRPYTSFYNLAESCVFSKQSPPPILLHLSIVLLILGTPSPEVTGLFCRVPSILLTQTPKYTLLKYLYRFKYGKIFRAFSRKKLGAYLIF